MPAAYRIKNRDARRLFLDAQGISEAPTGPLDLGRIIRQLGFVQLDTIQIVARAHHHILWSRNQHYREPLLDQYMTEQRGVFEHFTHDASVIPMDFYPMWTRQFRRMASNLRRRGWHIDEEGEKHHRLVYERIVTEGPLSTKDFERAVSKSKGAWSLPPHKRALEYLWYSGKLATAYRKNFVKYYDLAERVIPAETRGNKLADAEQVDWLCRQALERIAFGSDGDIQRFWDAVDLSEVKSWCAKTAANLVPVEVEGADRIWRKLMAPGDIETRLETIRTPTRRLRILNPFDPVIRDRTRLQRLFGFDYRVEMFVPAAKRRYGYYIYPLLEGDQFVGRIEVRADRKASTLTVNNLWPEPGRPWSKAREARLTGELKRLARFVGVKALLWE